MIDICVNLDSRQFNRDRDAVLERAWACGVEALIITATDIASTRTAINWSSPERLRCTAGVHPHHAAEVDPHWEETLAQLAAHPAVCAIGETGLDFNRNFSPREDQLSVFATQIALARRLAKPLFVHDRDSEGEVLRQLQAAGPLPPTVIHCFTGNAADLRSYLSAGFYIGITGWVADDKRGQALRALVPEIPLERLLLETDAPFLRPHNVPDTWPEEHGVLRKYKRRNEPALLGYVCEAVADCYGVSAARVAQATSDNAKKLFSL